jgi:2-polyprenyl-3-methyl-5-hydroxy-6-metoxy-1,4-benzoquinol methylase
MSNEQWIADNLANWNDRVPIHTAPDGYNLERFRTDPTALSDVLRYDRERLGDLTGLHVVHLQCHIGTDTLSLARLGAHVTGVDFSAPALDAARQLSTMRRVLWPNSLTCSTPVSAPSIGCRPSSVGRTRYRRS